MKVKEYRFSKRFVKKFTKLPPAKKEAVNTALDLYLDEPNAPSLRRHILKGKYAGQTSISAGGDLRIHLIEDDDIIIVVANTGTHSQLY